MTTHADLEARWRALGKVANGIMPTVIPLDPIPNDLTVFETDLRILARHVDALVKAYADYFTERTGHKIEARYTDDQLLSALDGNLLHEFTSAAEQLAQDLADAAA